MNPYQKRIKGRNIGDTGRVSERRTGKRIGGRSTVASGSVDTDKGDIDAGNFLIECKSTIKDSINVKLSYLAKIRGEALSNDRLPAFAITFTRGNGDPRAGGKWVAIPEHIFKEYFGEGG